MSQTHAPGTFCWVELSTVDAPAAKQFYAQLFGWDLHDDPLPSGGVYTMAKLGEDSVGAMYEMAEEQRTQGVPPHWMPYIAVESAVDAAARVKDLGGKVIMDAFDVFDIGSMAVLQDPTGAMFSVWQAKKHTGATVADKRPGSFCWMELMTTDVDRAGSFYSQLTGWDPNVMEMPGGLSYTVFMLGEVQAAGMMAIQEEMGPVPPHWMTYFAVADCDTGATKVTELGGKVVVPPTDIPMGRFALASDPQGAMFSLFQFAS